MAVSHVESCASPLNWFKCWKAATSASCTASSASGLFPRSLYAYRYRDCKRWDRTAIICAGEGVPDSRATPSPRAINFSTDGMLCSRSSVASEAREVACDPSELEFRFHLYAETDPGKGTTKTVSELVVFSDCLACCAAASSMSCVRTSWSPLST